MCGIAGYIGKGASSDLNVQKTLDLMKNRGPDNQSYLRITEENRVVELLHSRLSIIDLDERSNQPYCLDECILIYNGEIYNYIELSKQLEAKGISFNTSSDTEVLLRSYLVYGEDCVHKFEGMWSFAIYDKRKKRLFLSRDRFAEKPLYFFEDSDGFYFASEIKFIKSLSGKHLTVNDKQLFRHLINGYKSLYKNDETFFEGVKEIGYATNFFINASSEKLVTRYWHPKSQIDQSMGLEEAIEGTRHHLLESLKIRLRADVPMAFCLSGGVDSPSIVSIACKEFGYDAMTFSIIDDDERYNEEENILATVRDTGCRHELIKIPQEAALSRLQKLVAYHDAPIATITYFVHSMILECVARSGYRVSFSGTSADELFTGYYDHFLFHLVECQDHPNFERHLNQWEQHINAFVRNPLLKDHQRFVKDPLFRDHIYDGREEICSYLKFFFEENFKEESFTQLPLRNRMMNELFHEVTPSILHEDDLNSMFYSIENRSPYLDLRLFEFANSMPSEFLIRNGYGKFILREAMKGILNDQVRLDRRKKGFNASINSMIDLKDPEVRSYLLDKNSLLPDYFRLDSIQSLLNEDNIPNHLSKFIFNLINTRIFLEINS